MRTFNVAVAGALGLVGTTMVKILEEYAFPVNELRLLERPGLSGAPVKFRDRILLTTEASPDSFEGVDIALFATEEDASRLLVPEAVQRGAIAIDNSRAYRLDPSVPLVVPEVNAEDLAWQTGIVANPNCTTIGTVVVLKPIHDLSPIRRLVASTYQSTSGGALRGMLELRKQVLDVVGGFPVTPPQAFKYQVAFNLIPFIDAFEADGYTREEWKMVHETRRILHAPEMRITGTAVRVPTLIGHAVSCNIETAGKVTPEQARAALSGAPGVCVLDDIEQLRFPQPIEVAGGDLTHVGRIREDFSTPNALNLWLVSDNVRKGAAQNAVQIAQALVEREHLDRWQSARHAAGGAR